MGLAGGTGPDEREAAEFSYSRGLTTPWMVQHLLNRECETCRQEERQARQRQALSMQNEEAAKAIMQARLVDQRRAEIQQAERKDFIFRLTILFIIFELAVFGFCLSAEITTPAEILVTNIWAVIISYIGYRFYDAAS